MAVTAQAVTVQDTLQVDTSAVATDSVVAKKGFFKKLLGYIAPDLNTDEAKASTGLSIIGGPHYNSMSKLGVGLAASYGYRLAGCDSPLQPSVLSLTGNVTTVGFWNLAILNDMIIKGDKMRINSELKVENMPIYFWGMEFENGKNDANKTRMRQLRVMFNTNVLFRLTQGLFLGPYLHWEFNRADSISVPHLLEGQSLSQRNYGVGITLDYDTRDYVTGPTQGMYIHLNQVFFPRFLWNGNQSFTRTDFRFSIYRKAWRGAIIAGDVRALFNYGSPSWATMAQWGGPTNMRGYYRGRYRDKHMMNATVEVRQQLWRWLGMVAWIGGGTVFHDSHSMHFLPNAGLGLRWAFRKHVNIRLDYGFGRAGESVFIFGINEAF